MTYSLEFDPRAYKEWQKLDNGIKEQFKKKLIKVLENPKVAANKLSGFVECYKVKLRSSGFRLVYQVQDQKLVVLVVAIGKRDKEQAYKQAQKRLD